MSFIKYKRSEQETTRCWDPVDRIERIYTSIPSDIRKLDKLVEQYPQVYRCIWEEEDGGAKRYESSSAAVFASHPTRYRRKQAQIGTENEAKKEDVVSSLKKCRKWAVLKAQILPLIQVT